jgi:hypothetical protein
MILPAFRLISEMDCQLLAFSNDCFIEAIWNFGSVPKEMSSCVPACRILPFGTLRRTLFVVVVAAACF